MNNILKKEKFVSISDEEYEKQEEIKICPHCEKYGFTSNLNEIIYNEGPIPVDSDNWLQCYRCGKVIAKVHVKSENKLVGFINVEEFNQNPYDYNKTIIENIHNKKIKNKTENNIQKNR